MKSFVIIKTSKEEISPDVIGIKDSYKEALEIIFKDAFTLSLALEDIESEIDEYGYIDDSKGYRYNIVKYWE